MKKNKYRCSIAGGIVYSMVHHCGLILSLMFLSVMILTQGHVLAESLAVFDEVEADFGETPASGDNESLSMEGLPGTSFSTFSLFSVPDPARLSHTEHYTEPRFFPDRQPRVVKDRNYTWLIPLVLIFFMFPLIVRQQRKQPSGKHENTVNLRPFTAVGDTVVIRKSCLLLTILLLGAFSATTGHALVYSPVKDAVINVLGKDQKIFQTNIAVTPEAQAYLEKKLNWSPDKKAYKVYYAKGPDGNPQRYAFVLSDKLEICGGLHTYCVAVNADGTVYDVSILELTCDRSYCINKRSFLAQFKRFDMHNHTLQAKDYDAISGATLSTDLTRDIVQRALALMVIMEEHNHG